MEVWKLMFWVSKLCPPPLWTADSVCLPVGVCARQCGFLLRSIKMANRWFAKKALELVLEEREVFDDDEEGEDSEEEVSEIKDNYFLKFGV
ncbi:unnamed protein product [Anisakis simplex]|uniref:Uncharacterized protein n=1 Tax=Anisakis simplex TaxID=6269 RepID=A0A0M3K738_ANISI|nr:unnamed protein product [Anisakis simplex]